MDIDTKKYLLISLRGLMRPLIRLVLRNGLMYREFIQMCKHLYVEVASEEYGVRGRQTNVSRVALLTGLDRKEVKRVRDILQGSDDSIPQQHNADRISRILSGWHQDSAFITEEQKPKDLPITGDGSPSFAGLVKKYGSDVPVTAILKELVRVGVVTQHNSMVRVHKNYFIPDAENLSAIQRMGNVINDITTTLHHNFYRVDKAEPPRFERCATNLEIDQRCLPLFHEFINKVGQRFLEEVDSWLSQHEIEDKKNTSNMIRLGIGAYWIQGNSAIEGIQQ